MDVSRQEASYCSKIFLVYVVISKSIYRNKFFSNRMREIARLNPPHKGVGLRRAVHSKSIYKQQKYYLRMNFRFEKFIRK